MQLAVPQPRRHKVLMSFRYWNAWDVIFFDTDRMRTALPRRARFNSDEALIDRNEPSPFLFADEPPGTMKTDWMSASPTTKGSRGLA
jgi:hypothetical protein